MFELFVFNYVAMCYTAVSILNIPFS